MLSRRLLPVLLFCVAVSAAGETKSTPQAATLVEQKAAPLPALLAVQFRMSAAQTLQRRYPDLARKFVDATLVQLRAGKIANPGPEIVRPLAEIAPDDAVAVLPGAAPSTLPLLIGVLAQTNHTDRALALYRSSLSEGKVRVTAASPLIVQLAKERPAAAAALFREIVAGFSFDDLEPADAWWLVSTAASAASAAPADAADLYARILAIVSDPAYGEKSKSSVNATFKAGSATIATTNSRDALLLAAASRLHALAPERLKKFEPALSRWDFSSPVTLAGYGVHPEGAPPRNTADAASTASISQGLSQFRGKPTDADRAKLALEVAAQIHALPAGQTRLSWAQSLANLSTEGDLGREALTAVATTLGEAIRQTTADARAWLELASLIRYEHVPAPFADPALEAADSVLALRESLAQDAAFNLTALDGRTYSLAGLRGRVVLVNFWATWCPPCRKEMPDMEKLYRTFEKKGFTVLAVSDEDRDTVAGYLAKQNYSFPVLLDPGRKAHTAFNVEGIPKSFLFDREGKLAAQAIDMRTERQFLEMLKQAGLE